VSLVQQLILVPILIAMNAFFVAAEYAVIAIRPAQIADLRKRRWHRTVASIERLKANPAGTIGRAFSDTFAGIAPADVPAFIAAQLVGAAVGAGLTEAFHPRRGHSPEPLDLPDPVHHSQEPR